MCQAISKAILEVHANHKNKICQAADRIPFSTKYTDIFLIFPQKLMLCILIKIALMRCFQWVPQHVLGEK